MLTLERVGPYLWRIPPEARPGMRVPALVVADEPLMAAIRSDASLEQLANGAIDHEIGGTQLQIAVVVHPHPVVGAIAVAEHQISGHDMAVVAREVEGGQIRGRERREHRVEEGVRQGTRPVARLTRCEAGARLGARAGERPDEGSNTT